MLVAGAAAGLLLPAGWLVAQETPGMVLRFSLDQTLTAAENPELIASPPRDSFIARTDLGMSLTSETRVQRFTFSLGGSFEAGDFAGQQTGDAIIAGQRVGLDYGYATRATAIDLDASYNRSVRRAVLIEEFIGEDLLTSGGEQSRLRLGFGIRTGLDAPWGVQLSGALTRIGYHDVPGDSLSDRDLASLEAGLRFALTPRTDLTLLTGHTFSEYDDARGYRSETSYTGLDVSHEASDALRYFGGLRYNEVETSEFPAPGSPRLRDRSSGFGGSLGASLDRPNGTIGLRIASDFYDTGRRNVYSISRALELRQGRLAVSAGISDTARSDPRAQFGIDYAHELRHSTVSLGLSQATVSDEDREAQRSRLSLGWRGDLDQLSGWEADLSIADYRILSGGGNDTRRIDGSLAYVRNLTEDWALRLGYTHSRADSDSYDRTRTDNAVFLGLRSSFSLLP